jgi:hypothetical protein
MIASASGRTSHWGNHLNLGVILCVNVLTLFNRNCDHVFLCTTSGIKAQIQEIKLTENMMSTKFEVEKFNCNAPKISLS